MPLILSVTTNNSLYSQLSFDRFHLRYFKFGVLVHGADEK